jgi:hypothetical protein
MSLDSIHLSSAEQTNLKQKDSLERIATELLGFREPEECKTVPNMYIYIKPNTPDDKIQEILEAV